MNFWQKLPKPIIGLAPMDGVTDYAFRKIVKKYSKPDVMFTEFTHVKGLWFGKLKVYNDLKFDEKQRPIVAQIFGSEPEYFYKIAHIICELGFDGIDINMGCPAKSVVERGGGSDLINKPKLAQEIIRETKKGVKDWTNGQTLKDIGFYEEKIEYIRKLREENNEILLSAQSNERKEIPVSVKTRLGYKKNIVKEWIKYLIEASPSTITMHGRTYKQLYGGKADWESIACVGEEIRKAGIVYLGNGDIKGRIDGEEKCKKYSLDGALIGRASFGNPWVFADKIVDKKEKFKVCIEHATAFDKFYEGQFFYAFRKNMAWYCKGFDGAKELRIKLMQVESLKEMEENLKVFTKKC